MKFFAVWVVVALARDVEITLQPRIVVLAVSSRDALQGTIEAQERDIDELKKSVYELSYMLSMQVTSFARPWFCFPLYPACTSVSIL